MSDAVNEISASRTTQTPDGSTPRRRVEQVLAGWLPPEETAATGSVNQGELVAPVQRINEVMRPYGVEFELSETTSRVVTRLVDRDTRELIRQIPAEEVMRVAEHLEELQGRLIDLEA
ncbi:MULTISPECIES: flagellar protein FlaG [Halomonas]|uniref:Flagellar protein FlaG n=1 Tax=Halomonas halophila TaxID=29573 RepID=A0ABQ0U7D0_9GAMM|nr:MULTISPECIES: flagellar protein FlaG [Halomonas]MDR5889249.1 flagellar protein FlaG [Halomonas salina]RAH36397.1 flagellar protein [Halomonas sp. SL1]WJY07197.1 flagellar protein FlaG [Halomonas halophila]GEK74422.1 flagellar protein FlaG [Halomonas halophila]